jgi:toxin ParE1/3/4
MTVVFREEALADLDEIGRFIAEHDPIAANRVIARIHRTIYRTIAVLPLCGRPSPTNATREYAVPGLPYLVIYLPVPDGIDVIAVFHTARDPGSKRNP